MKKYFWMIAIVALIGFFSNSANAYDHGRHRAYNAGYSQGVRDARHYHHHGYYHPRYYGHRHYAHPRYYAPRAVVRVNVPVPRPPRVIIRP